MTDDLDRIMAVMEAAFEPAYGEAWTRRQVEEALVVPGIAYLLAASDGTEPPPGAPAAGFSLCRTVLDEQELLLLAVDPAQRRQGVGSGLLSRVIAAASASGVKRLFLEMRDGNPAESLYRRHGFTQIGRRRHYYRRGSGAAHDAITFTLSMET